MQHLDEGTIHAWLDGALPPGEAKAVEAHIGGCVECAALVAEARGLIAGASRIVSSLDQVPAGVLPKPPAQSPSLWRTLRLTPARASIAALILVGVASMFTARRGEHLGRPERSEGPQSSITRHPERSEGPLPSVADSTAHPRSAAAAAPTVAAPTVAAPTVAAPTVAAPAVAPPSPSVATRTETVPREAPVPQPQLAKPSLPAPAAEVSEKRVAASALEAVRATGMAAPQRMLRQAFDESPASPEGCYRLLPDSARMIAMPERFALQRDSIGRNVVLQLSAENRPDSVLGGFTWRRVSPTIARVIAPTTQLVLTTSGSLHGRLETANGTVDIPLQRTACGP